VGRVLPDATFAALPFGADAWRLVATGEAARAAPVPALFALGNGFVGMRGPGETADAPRIYLNGVFEKMSIAYHEAAYGFARESDTRLAVADATRPIVALDGIALDAPDRIELDMRHGLAVQVFEAAGRTVRIEQLVAMDRSGVVATRITISAGAMTCRIVVRPVVTPPPGGVAHDPETAHDPRVGPAFAASPWRMAIEGAQGRADCLHRSGFAVAARVVGGGDVTLAPGETATIECVAAYAARRGDGAAAQAFAAAGDALDAAHGAGFGHLAAEQAAWFAAFWEDALVAFPETPAAEQSLRHALFQLVQAVGRDGATSIGAKGQTGEGYEGHVFWDADSYVLPALVFLRPEIARSMLQWRIDRLDAARANARALGQERGALYPWRTIDGHECSAYFPAGSAQYHINADIAHALRLYVETTGDRSILAEGGAEMLAETARIWLEIGFHDPARGHAFVINRVTGPDEYSALVDNNLYTNMMAAEHLRFAAAEAIGPGLLTAEEGARMKRAAAAMFLPFDEARQIHAQDDAFFAKQAWPFAETPAGQYPLLLHFHPLTIYRHQVAKQADAVLATVTLRDRFEPAMRRRMLDIYEAVTVHDSTLSASAFAAAAAGVGDADRATAWWRVSLLTDLLDLFGNSGHGLHMAALAGSWTALATGFAGMRTTEDRLSFAPIAMPEIGPYIFRARYRGRRIEVRVDATDTRYRLLAGEALTIFHRDVAIALELGGEAIAA
jgi:trehalose/maltose hydrolase-like predicted phosphorylase